MNLAALRLLLAAAIGVASLRCPAAETKSPAFRELSFDAASAQAATDQKMVFIDFYTTWCAPCKMLDETTWQDAKVIALLQANAVAVKIDAEKERALAARYQVAAYPTLLLLKPDGTELDRLVGYRPPEKFLEEFTAALAGKGSTHRAQEAVAVAQTVDDKVKARYELGQNLAQQGKHAEALVEFLWCYEEGMPATPSFAGVRNSFLLSDIMELAAAYPAARAALVERRDKLQASFLAGSADRRAVTDLGALNRELGEDEKTLELFDRLPATDKRRAALGRSLLPLFLKAQRYQDALSSQPYPQVAQMAAVLSAQSPGAAQPPEVQAVHRRFMIKWFAEHLEILAGANDLDHARELLAKAQAYDASAGAVGSYQEHLTRAGHPELLTNAPAATPPGT